MRTCKYAKLRLIISACLSACPRGNNSAPTARIFVKFCYLIIFREAVEKFQVSLKSDKNNWFLHEALCTFMILSRWIILSIRNVSYEGSIENETTHSVFSNIFFSLENLAVYEIIWKNIVDQARSQTTVRRMCIACWIPKATDTHSEYVILIAFPLQQWLSEHGSMSRYPYNACRISLCSRFVRIPTQQFL